MEKKIKIKDAYLYLPICGTLDGAEKNNQRLEIFCREGLCERKLFEFQIPAKVGAEEYAPVCYNARFPVKQFTDKTLILRGELPKAFFDLVTNDGGLKGETFGRPSIHFTAETGWINDPNGLVYQNGIYHLYFQYNAFDIQWENMSWGHAISRDLLHWEQLDSVLFPDQNGTMFSGSGIVNEKEMLGLPQDALLFFYTAAGSSNRWSAKKQFTQRIAYSLDQGETLTKTDVGALDAVCSENRDPKVFWHEESQAYIMVLWLEKNDFGIFRSINLENWDMTDRLTLDQAWECPDLICLSDSDGCDRWVFLSADGYYFIGMFDGYHFCTDGVRNEPYIGKVPYAAQTYSGTKGRTVSVSWLRLSNRGRVYTGAMGLPRELNIIRHGAREALTFLPVREYEAAKKEITMEECDNPAQKIQTHFFYQEKTEGTAVELQVVCREDEPVVTWEINKTALAYYPGTGIFVVGEQRFQTAKDIQDFSFIVDDVILEVTAEYGTIIGVFELADSKTEICTQRTYFKEIHLYKTV